MEDTWRGALGSGLRDPWGQGLSPPPYLVTFALGLQDLGGVRKGFWFIELQPEICWLYRANSPTEHKGKWKFREGKRPEACPGESEPQMELGFKQISACRAGGAWSPLCHVARSEARQVFSASLDWGLSSPPQGMASKGGAQGQLLARWNEIRALLCGHLDPLSHLAVLPNKWWQNLPQTFPKELSPQVLVCHWRLWAQSWVPRESLKYTHT